MSPITSWMVLDTGGRTVFILALLSLALEFPAGGSDKIVCHPQGLRSYIVNWEVTAAALIQWLHRDLLRSGDAEIRHLLDELLGYPDVPRNWRTLDLDAPTTPGDTHLRFFTTLTTLGTPYDITLHELRIENFFPADDATDTALRRLNARAVT